MRVSWDGHHKLYGEIGGSCSVGVLQQIRASTRRYPDFRDIPKSICHDLFARSLVYTLDVFQIKRHLVDFQLNGGMHLL